MTDLPIDEVLPGLLSRLDDATRLVFAAPPGAGKTTRLPVALLDRPWATGKILVLEPRRIAARLAAERMADQLGEKLGRTIGLSTRIDRKVSADTRIEVVTDGLFMRRLLNDPELDGVSAVLFDEFHERSLTLDMGLAFARDAQAALREDLRLIVMSATLDTDAIAERFGADAIESAGRAFPVEIVYLGRDNRPLEERTAAAVRRALRETQGSVLVFLPGRRDILRTTDALDTAGLAADIFPLYGALSPQAQDAAVAPPAQGVRKVILATDIAESSLTIAGVTAVIDSGLAKIARYDASAGANLLETRRIARANADQRAGRAGRTAPGVCYRLWREPETIGLDAAPIPEIQLADLSPLVLSSAEWGERRPETLPWIDPPPPGRLTAARAELLEIGAINDDGGITDRGRRIARVAAPPRIAAMVVAAATAADAYLAAEIAILLSEQGLGGGDVDLRTRLTRFRADNGKRATALRSQAARWADGAAAPPTNVAAETVGIEAIGRAIVSGDPRALARRRPNEPGVFVMANGRAARLPAGHPLISSDWLAIASVAGSASAATITAAAPIEMRDAIRLRPPSVEDAARFDAKTGKLSARRLTRIGAIVLKEEPLPAPKGAARRDALVSAVQEAGLDILPGENALRSLQARLSLLGRTQRIERVDFSDETLLRLAHEWLAPSFGEPPELGNATGGRLIAHAMRLLDFNTARRLDEDAPLEMPLPSGRRAPIDYTAEAGPTLDARAQELFGLDQHPSIVGGTTPIVLVLTSPAGRPIATTTDLPGFWRGGYADMAKDMRGRYPKHDWPADPATATAHAGRTKASLARSKG